jgi:hypothetical protein
MNFDSFFEKLSDEKDRFLSQTNNFEANPNSNFEANPHFDFEENPNSNSYSNFPAYVNPDVTCLEANSNFETQQFAALKFDIRASSESNDPLRDSTSDIRNLLQNITMENLDRHHPSADSTPVIKKRPYSKENPRRSERLKKKTGDDKRRKRLCKLYELKNSSYSESSSDSSEKYLSEDDDVVWEAIEDSAIENFTIENQNYSISDDNVEDSADGNVEDSSNPNSSETMDATNDVFVETPIVKNMHDSQLDNIDQYLLENIPVDSMAVEKTSIATQLKAPRNLTKHSRIPIEFFQEYGPPEPLIPEKLEQFKQFFKCEKEKWNTTIFYKELCSTLNVLCETIKSNTGLNWYPWLDLMSENLIIMERSAYVGNFICDGCKVKNCGAETVYSLCGACGKSHHGHYCCYTLTLMDGRKWIFGRCFLAMQMFIDLFRKLNGIVLLPTVDHVILTAYCVIQEAIIDCKYAIRSNSSLFNKSA